MNTNQKNIGIGFWLQWVLDRLRMQIRHGSEDSETSGRNSHMLTSILGSAVGVAVGGSAGGAIGSQDEAAVQGTR